MGRVSWAYSESDDDNDNSNDDEEDDDDDDDEEDDGDDDEEDEGDDDENGGGGGESCDRWRRREALHREPRHGSATVIVEVPRVTFRRASSAQCVLLRVLSRSLTPRLSCARARSDSFFLSLS